MIRPAKDHPVLVRLTTTEHEALRGLSAQFDMSMGQVMREALKAYIDRLESQNQRLAMLDAISQHLNQTK